MRPILPDYSRQVFTQAWPELDLRPHPEGGWFRETYRSAHTFTPRGYDGPRAADAVMQGRRGARDRCKLIDFAMV